MAIDANPNANLQNLAEFDLPILAGPQYDLSGEQIIACAQVPATSGGPGGLRFPGTLPLAASLLPQFSKIVSKLDFPTQQNIAQAVGIQPEMSLQSAIDLEVEYLKYLEGRDQLLLSAMTGLMNLTK